MELKHADEGWLEHLLGRRKDRSRLRFKLDMMDLTYLTLGCLPRSAWFNVLGLTFLERLQAWQGFSLFGSIDLDAWLL